MAYIFCIFVLHELLNCLSLSIEALSSENIIVCKCSDSIKGIFRLDFSRHWSLLVCKNYHSWFYPTLEVTENKVLQSFFEILSNLQFLDYTF